MADHARSRLRLQRDELSSAQTALDSAAEILATHDERIRAAERHAGVEYEEGTARLEALARKRENRERALLAMPNP